ncbi:molybdopterin-dependent oxidoreductase [Geoalkalibacter sp.]|uniref:molybdopterin-dependent oxidoreductase n=1 Tax=Geoalkalibacter sp. TaxID=3041440 RepID=UPI00272EE01A|nr:4Fe-4S dicluster domain-containing protein [Geoalkalibacter sp.]
MERRNFLRLLGFFGSTLLPGCRKEGAHGTLISQLVPPGDGVVPGEAQWRPSTCGECPAHCGVLVRLREGRPVKLEGHPDHPLSRGGLCLRGQAGLERRYHPRRILAPRRKVDGQWRDLSWDEALAVLDAELTRNTQAGRRSVYLSGRTTGTLGRLIEDFCRATGVERLPEHELYAHANLRAANDLLFARPELPQWHLAQADLLLTLGADILETFVQPVAFAAELTQARDAQGLSWWHAAPQVSLTGAGADQELTLRPGSEAALLRFLLASLVARPPWRERLPEALREWPEAPDLSRAADATGLEPRLLQELAEALMRAKAPLVIAGGIGTAHGEGLETALLAGLLQRLVDPDGARLSFARGQNYAGLGTLRDMQALAQDLTAKQIGVIFLARCNPVYNTPDDYAFGQALSGAGFRVVLADLEDETTNAADLLLPLAHGLESWGDAEPVQGVLSLFQPLTQPFGAARGEGDILLELWRRLRPEEPPEAQSYRDYLLAAWEQRLIDQQLGDLARQGWVELPASAEAAPALRIGEPAAFLSSRRTTAEGASPGLLLTPSLRHFDGRGRALALLSEIPDPLTTISWGAWLAVAPEDARSRRLKDQDLADIDLAGRRVSLPVKIQPGLRTGVLTVTRDALPGLPLAVDERTGELLAWREVGELRRGGRTRLPILSGSTSQHGRGIIPDPVHRDAHEPPRPSELYPEHEHAHYRWAMVIDLERCTGCSACVAACYIENNVPVVGLRDHLKGREMSWLRIEPYYDSGRPQFIPMLCQHCHYAPCEPVCPVYAAYHNPEGLNVQVYQRCVGTRYCSHNCPYKVRRFNWWEHRREAPLDEMLNPDLVARGRGIMEKCTFCIQRIRAARDHAKDQGRLIADGEVIPACAQSCPARAISFGNLRDPEARVAKLVDSLAPHRVFAGLGTEPSVYYLPRGRSK